MSFAKAFIAARENAGLTQREAAEKLCVNQSTVCFWETGRNFPRASMLVKKDCSFDVTDIRYSMNAKAYTVSLQLKEQYLGDISRYQAQIDALEEDRTRLESDSANMQDTIQQLTGQLAEADETAIALFEELEAARAENPEAGEPPAPDVLDPAEAGEVTQ